jgi:hypothetical protein
VTETYAIGGVETARPPEYAKSSQPVRADASPYPSASRRKGITGMITAYEKRSVATPEEDHQGNVQFEMTED